MPSIEALKRQLEAERDRIRSEIEELDRRLEVKPDYSLGAGDPAVYQWEFNLALRQQTLEKLEDIEDALARMADNRYGKCLKCGREIEEERLEVLPSAALCIRCAQSRR